MHVGVDFGGKYGSRSASSRPTEIAVRAVNKTARAFPSFAGSLSDLILVSRSEEGGRATPTEPKEGGEAKENRRWTSLDADRDCVRSRRSRCEKARAARVTADEYRDTKDASHKYHIRG